MDSADTRRSEIERHKYFLSEKAGQDVGWESAERDWELRHGAAWRMAHGDFEVPAVIASAESPRPDPQPAPVAPRSLWSRFRLYLARVFTS